MSDQVGNPKVRFSCDAAHIEIPGLYLVSVAEQSGLFHHKDNLSHHESHLYISLYFLIV